MQLRTLGRTGWKISEIGYGMWGLAGWSGSDDAETERALERAVEMGCTFFDTAWAYGNGRSEQILGRLVKRHADARLFIATKIPPKNFTWPARTGTKLEECFPPQHIVEYTEKSLANLGVEAIDLTQFHVWDDGWAADDRWQKAIEKLKKEGKIRAAGISINRWEPDNSLKTLKSGHIDAVQVIYNIFDQSPEDNLFPLCRKLNIGVIARVPFDEGTLTGKLTKDTKFPADDWRAHYFTRENLVPSVERAEKLKPLVPEGMTLPELALRFILANSDVSTTIPGMRRREHVSANLGASDGRRLPPAILAELKKHRWDRVPTAWSD